MPDLDAILTVTGSLVAGAVVALKVIAPRTRTVYDDRALSFLEKVGSVLGLVRKVPAPAPARPRVVDHR